MSDAPPREPMAYMDGLHPSSNRRSASSRVFIASKRSSSVPVNGGKKVQGLIAPSSGNSSASLRRSPLSVRTCNRKVSGQQSHLPDSSDKGEILKVCSLDAYEGARPNAGGGNRGQHHTARIF